MPAAFDYDAQTQQPADRWKRAELNYSCVEYVAPTEYMVKKKNTLKNIGIYFCYDGVFSLTYYMFRIIVLIFEWD